MCETIYFESGHGGGGGGGGGTPLQPTPSPPGLSAYAWCQWLQPLLKLISFSIILSISLSFLHIIIIYYHYDVFTP